MPRYVYKAKQGPTKTVEGDIVADSRQAALEHIDRMGYSPIFVEEQDFDDNQQTRVSGRGIGSRDVNVFTRQLASMIRAGVSILRALRTIQQQTENKRMAAVVEDVHESIRGGKMLSEALMSYPRLFPELYINLVRSGETAGALETMLQRIAEAREKEEEIRKKVQSALAYPILILLMGIITVGVMVGYLLPRISQLFPTVEDLPWPTQVLIYVSRVLSDQGLLILLLLALGALIVRQTASSGKGRSLLDGMVLRIPWVGLFVRQVDISRFARTLGLLVQTGISIDRALGLSAGTLSNQVLREEVEAVREATVERGSSVAGALARSQHFPLFATNMIAVGEETGSLENSLDEIASFYEREVELLTRMLTTLIEPILIMLIGAVVGFIVFAMLMPIFEIGQAIG
ncbi:MAG: type II secretion system F family protein [Verrucomicrobia bacterium]|nr:type II secretion system F family protein [Verrucomicrobiota bacterium]MDA1087424.1 type II secretion system F family protein [Verrucomicrobiota bacterium]